MTFAKSYEPGEYESDIYAAWEASGIFNPKLTTKPVDNDGDGVDDRNDAKNTYSIVMPPPNANGNLHIGHGLTIALEDSLTRYYRISKNTAIVVSNMIVMNSTLVFGISLPNNVAIWSFNSVLLAHHALGMTLPLL